jgi:hypothetical protein
MFSVSGAPYHLVAQRLLWVIVILSAATGCKKDEPQTPAAKPPFANSPFKRAPRCELQEKCKTHGFCTAATTASISLAPRCKVGSDGDCQRSHLCRDLGLCKRKSNQACRAHSNLACAAAAICQQKGHCAFDPKTISCIGCAGSEGCKIEGRCTPSKTGCIAATDKDCAASKACKRGYCRAKSGFCINPKLTTQTCKEAKACPEKGRCTAIEGRCQAKSDEDCRASLACRSLRWNGPCLAQNGICVRDCSKPCRRYGGCRPEGTLCKAPSTDAGCATTPACRLHGYCAARQALCRAATNLHCKESEDCKKFGKCSFDGKEYCQAKTHEECAKSESCVKDGRCLADRGICIRGKSR